MSKERDQHQEALSDVARSAATALEEWKNVGSHVELPVGFTKAMVRLEATVESLNTAYEKLCRTPAKSAGA
jgi:hypothetical protein